MTLNYDPNFQWTEQVVRLVFAAWDFRKTMEVTVTSNIKGLHVIEAAIDIAYEQLLGSKRFASILMRNEEDTLLVEDEDKLRERWLSDMLVDAEVVSMVEVKK